MFIRRFKTFCKYFLSILSLVTVTVAGLVFWNLTDVDRLKELAIMQLETLTGRQVNVGSAELDWSKGISVRLSNVSISGAEDGGPESSARSVWVVAKLLPFLEKQIEVQKVIVNGAYLLLERNAEGAFRLGGWTPKASSGKPSAWTDFLKVKTINAVSFQESSLKFVDHTQNFKGRPHRINLENFHINLYKPLLKKELNFELGGEIPNDGPPAFINTTGTLGAEVLTGDFSNISVAGKIKVQSLLLNTATPYLKFASLKAPENSRISFDLDFEGTDSWKFKGNSQYSVVERDGFPSLSNRSTANRASARFEALYDGTALELKNVFLKSGRFHLKAYAKSRNIFAKDPKIRFVASTDPFYINKSSKYLPLKILPDRVHSIFQSRFKGGTIKIKSLKFKGRLSQLKGLGTEANDRLISAELDLDRVDWMSPLPDFKKVTGSLKLNKGDSNVLISKTTFKGLPISQINGTIDNLLHQPVADLHVKNEVELEAFKQFLIRILQDDPFVETLNQLDEIEGKGVVNVALKGSLEDDDDLSISGHLDIKDASMKRAGLSEVVTSVNGEVFYNEPSEIEKNKTGVFTSARLDNFSGKLMQSSFSKFNASLNLDSKDPFDNISSKLHINLIDLPKLLADFPLSRSAEESLKLVEFTGGFIDVERFVTADPKTPGSERTWGTAYLRNASIKYRDRFQSLMNLTGAIKFADGSPLLLENIAGWYGNSPLKLNGKIDRENQFAYALNFDLEKLFSGDLEDIPHMQSLKFEGPLHLTGNLQGKIGSKDSISSDSSFLLNYELEKTLRNDFKSISHLKDWNIDGPLKIKGSLHGINDRIEFDQYIDFTSVAYHRDSIISKPEGVSNPIHLQGVYTPAEGLKISQLLFDLGNLRLKGSGIVSAGEIPAFDFKIEAPEFEIASASQYFKPLAIARQGKINLAAHVNGSLDQWDKVQPVARLNFTNLMFDPSNPSTLPGEFSGRLEHKGNDYFLKDVQWMHKDSKLSFQAEYKDSESPNLDLRLTKGILKVVNDGPEQEENKKSGLRELMLTDAPLLNKGAISVNLNLDALAYKKLNLKNVSGKIDIKDRKLSISRLDFGDENSIHTEGTLSFYETKPMEFKNRLIVKNMKAKGLMASIGPDFQNGLTGKVNNISANLSGQGDQWKDISASLTGSLEVNLEDGNFHKKHFKKGIQSLSNEPVVALLEKEASIENEEEETTNASNEEDENIPFDKITGKFTLVGGVAKTDDLIFESPGRRTSLVGKFDLAQNNMDLVVGVAPLADLDKLLTQIPLVGKILTAGDEESLLKAYYTAKGPFSNPEVTAIPFVSLGKKVMGIFQGILQTPQEILSIPTPDETTN